MGCLARLGCLIMLVILAVAGWITRDRWLPQRFRSRAAVAATSGRWIPLTKEGADSTRVALTKLGKPRGPAFETVSGAAAASYVFMELAKALPTDDSIEVAVLGDKIAMRAAIPTAALSEAGLLGPFASMLGDREKVQLVGTLRVVKPGLAEFQITEMKIRDIIVPTGMVPHIVHQLDRRRRQIEVSDTGIPLALPSYVGDIRVANGKVTLYKTVN